KDARAIDPALEYLVSDVGLAADIPGVDEHDQPRQRAIEKAKCRRGARIGKVNETENVDDRLERGRQRAADDAKEQHRSLALDEMRDGEHERDAERDED